MPSPNRVKHMMLVLWRLRDGGSLEIRDLARHKTGGKHEGKRLNPKKGRLQTLIVGCLFGKYSTFSQPDGFFVD